MNIFIIDHNLDFSEAISDILEQNGHQVFTETDIQCAIKQLDIIGSTIDFILMEISHTDPGNTQICHEISRRAPNAIKVCTSGYRIDQIISRMTGRSNIYRIKQPIEAKDIYKLLKQQSDCLLIIQSTTHQFELELSRYLESKIQNNAKDNCGHDISTILIQSNDPVLFCLNNNISEINQNTQTSIIITHRHNCDTTTPGEIKSAIELGCLHKPFSPEALINYLNTLEPRQHITEQSA